MLPKESSTKVKLTFRAPATVRRAIKWGAKKLEVNQSDFVVLALDDFLSAIERNESISELALPEDFQISQKDNRMMGININPEVIDIVDNYTDRFYHSRTRLILWAVLYKALALAQDE